MQQLSLSWDIDIVIAIKFTGDMKSDFTAKGIQDFVVIDKDNEIENKMKDPGDVQERKCVRF
jgi:hypothetical protein